jgi:RNA recognition motif-containing protein
MIVSMYRFFIHHPFDVAACVVCALAGLLAGLILQKRFGAYGADEEGNSDGGDNELYVGNLSYDISDKELAKLFAKHGKVVKSRIIRNRSSGKSKGYGFVTMASSNDVETAVSALDGNQYKGRKIVVNEAKSRARD